MSLIEMGDAVCRVENAALLSEKRESFSLGMLAQLLEWWLG